MMPRGPLFCLVGGTVLCMAAGIVAPGATGVGLAATVLLVLAAAVDRWRSPRLSRVDVYRDAAEVLSVGARNAVWVWFKNRNRRALTLSVHDDHPVPGDVEDLPFTIELPPRQTRYRIYHVTPHKRGLAQFDHIYLRCPSRWRLWTLTERRPLQRTVRVYPDIQAIHGVELLARQNRLAEAGVRMSRLRGRGNEFDRLREYRREDEYRSIDWKATARRQELVAREYVVERNQNVLFLLDCGRSMCNEHDGITHFDRALNAVILLAYVALRQGDTVGALCFSNHVERWIPPVRGRGAVQTLIRQMYDLHPRYEASDYNQMVEQLRHRYRKRSLVVLVTYALDEVHLQAIGQHMRELRKPHLVLGAFLQNVPLHERLNTFPQTTLEAFQVGAAAEMVAAQARQVATLRKRGLLVVDSLPEQLSANLISQYLEVKARHLL